ESRSSSGSYSPSRPQILIGLRAFCFFAFKPLRFTRMAAAARRNDVDPVFGRPGCFPFFDSMAVFVPAWRVCVRGAAHPQQAWIGATVRLTCAST
ncbi:hypothetical protein C8247_17655, partial [Paracidovorax avenae]